MRLDWNKVKLMSDEHVTDLLPGYALGCLDDDELQQVARHLPRCPACSRELQTYRQAVEQAALAQPRLATPPGLRQKVINRVAQQAAARAARPAPGPARPGWRSTLAALFTRPAAWGLGLAALLLAAVLGINNLRLAQQLNELQARLPPGQVVVVHLAATEAAPGAAGYLIVYPNQGYGTLSVQGAPQLDPAHQYQLWLIKDGKRTSGGVFSVSPEGHAALQITADQPLTSFQSFGVTVEPSGGSPGPTGKKVLGGNL